MSEKHRGEMISELVDLYKARHPDWEDNYQIVRFIKEQAIRELYAIEIEVHGDLKRALKENV